VNCLKCGPTVSRRMGQHHERRAMTGDNKHSRPPSAFRQQDVTRAFRAAKAAGVRVARIEIDRDGKIVIVTGEAPVQDSTPLDNWMAKHGSHQT
jgi:hypothetical protein